jgi:hypothetical protein
VAEGGKIFLRATEKIELTASSKLSADGTVGGEITAITHKDGQIAGELVARGEISAQGSGTVGSGGFIETSAAKLGLNGVTVNTNGGKWLIDPNDFTIAATGGDITGSALSAALANNNVTIQTTDTNATCIGVTCGTGTAGNGDIFVNDTVSWGSTSMLTLSAYRHITINQSITVDMSTPIDGVVANGKLALLYGQGAVANGNTATYNINAPVNLQAGDNFITQLGSDGTVFVYKVITDLGISGSNSGDTLQGMRGDLAGHYVLGSNIDASVTSTWNSGAGFLPVGNANTPFTGTFDGLGHTISGLRINQPLSNGDGIGLFGTVALGASVRNTGVSGSITGDYYVGGLVGYNNGTITNSYATATVVSDNYGGGLVGYNKGTISSSYANGSVTGSTYSYYLGGLVGRNNAATISDSHADVVVTAGTDSQGLGGLVGYNDVGTISNSYATGNVTGGSRSSNLGGLVGDSFGITSITNSYANGRVTGTGEAHSVGGLVGSNDDGAISNSYATGNVSAGTYGSDLGGLVGSNDTGTINNSYATGSVTTGNGIGAIDRGVRVGYVGGLVGYSGSNSVINASYANGNVNGDSDTPYIGGLVGRSLASISNSYSTGNVTTLGFNDYVGGFVGENSGSISFSYASGVVNANAFRSSYIGGFVGNNGRVISQSFYNKTSNPNLTGISGVADVAGTVWGLSDSDLRLQDNFNTATSANGGVNANWDFNTIWTIDSGAFTSYPYLRTNPQTPPPSQRALTALCSVCTWDGGGGNGLWSLATNWTGDVLPAAASSVTIGSSFGTILFDINSLSLTALTASSALDIQNGKTLTLTGSGTFNAIVSGAGTFNIAGASVNANANTINVANLNLSAGSLFGTGNLTVSNNFNWTGGTLGGAFQNLSLAKQGNFSIGGISAVGNITLDAQGEGDLSLTGNVSKTGGAAATLSLKSDGTIVVGNGVTLAMAGSGNTMEFTAPGGVTNGGTISAGGGTLNVTGDFTNFGSISPGGDGQIGTLNVTGNLSLTSDGTLNIDLGGTGVGQSDHIYVTGDVETNGMLDRSLISGYNPALGDEIPFLTTNGLSSGTFDVIDDLTNLVTGYRLAPSEAVRQIFSGPGYNTFTNFVGGLTWETPGNWSAGYIPDVTQTAIVTSSPLSPVTHSTGTDSIAGLLISAGNALDISGGSLAVSGTTSVGGMLSLLDGTYANNGTLNIAGLFSLFGGTFSGAGAININGGTLNVPSDSTVSWIATGPMANSGTMSLTNQTITNAITNSGTFNSGGGLTFTQLFSNQATFNANSGMSTFSNGLTQNAGNLVLGGGNVTGDITLNGGSLKGAGTVTGNVSLGAATLAPGASPGTLNITGNLTLSPTSTTLIELWGTTVGLFDVINVSGTASLAGALNATTGNGYVPGVGHALRFMTFASSTGSFGSTSLPSGMSLSALATALDLLGPAVPSTLPTEVNSSVNLLDNLLNLGAVSFETPLLYLAGQSSPTASSSGTLTQTAEIVLPDLMPEAPAAGDSGDDANNGSAVAGLLPLFDQLVRDARFKDTPHDSRLICR